MARTNRSRIGSRPNLLGLITLVLILAFFGATAEAAWEQGGLDGRYIHDTLVFPDTFNPTNLTATDQGVFQVSLASSGPLDDVVPRNSGLPPGAVFSLAFGPSGDPNVVYAATAQGVFKSEDRGENWVAFNGGMPADKYCPSIRRSGNYLFAALPSSGVYRSDGSGPWEETPGQIALPYSVEGGSNATGAPLLLAGTSGDGLWVTYDGGAGWLATGLTSEMAYYINNLATDPLSPGTWYAGNGDAEPSPQKGPQYDMWMYVTHDYGFTWTNPFDGSIPSQKMTGVVTDFQVWSPTPPPRISAPGTPSPVFVGTWGGEIFQNLDGGSAWTNIAPGLPAGVPITELGQLGNYLLAGVQGRGYFKLAMNFCTVTCSPSAAPPSGSAPLSVVFNPGISAPACGGGPWVEWNFGDGTTSVEMFPTHIYAQPGSYAWTLSATVDGHTCSGNGTVTVTSSQGTLLGSTVVGTAANAYPLSGLGFSAKALLTDAFGNTREDPLDSSGAFDFAGLTPGAFQVRVELEYRDHVPYDAQSGTMGCPHPSGDGITKRVTSRPVQIQVAAGSNAVEVRFPPPLILVHGVPGCYQKWFSDDPATPDYAALWDIAAREAGVISFTPNYAWSGPCTSWNRMASQLGDQVLDDLTGLHDVARGPSLPPVVLAAYDFGGLVVRALCSGPYAVHPATTAIQGIFLLATPNSGADSLFGGGANVLTSPNFVVRRFNEIYPSFGTKNSSVYAVGGNDGWWGLSDSDGRVSLYSAFNIARTSCNDITAHLSICRPYTYVSFPSGNGHIFPYTHDEVGSPPSTQAILQGTILPLLLDGQILGSPESPAGSTIWGTGARTTGSAQGTVQSRADAGVSQYPFVCSATDGMAVIAYASEGSAAFEVVPPGGRSTFRPEADAGQSGEFFFAQLNPEPGEWTLNITPGPEGVTFQAVMLESSLFGISAYTDKTAYAPGEVAILRADEDISLAPEAQFTEVVATIYETDGALHETVNLLDNGENHDGDEEDGQWGASPTAPTSPGSYPVVFKARGTYDGKDFVRTSRETLDVVPETHLFTGVFSDAPVDLDGDGKYDFIRFSAQLDLPAGCGVAVSGDLTDADGEFIGHATTFVEPPTRGLVEARLWFRLERLFCTQLLRALQVTNLAVLDGLSLAPADIWGEPVSTANYSPSSFDCRAGTVTPSLGAVRPDQATQGQALDLVVSGRGFRAGATLDFGEGIVLRRMVYLGPTAIAASVTVLETAAPGPRAVTVTNPGNASDTVQDAFDVVAPSSPAVVLQTPNSGQTIRGTILASAAASDAVRVAEVALLVDGNPVATDLTFPFQFHWDSRSVPNGSHSLAAQARNSAGLTRTSAESLVSVDNPTTPGDCDGSGTVSIGEVQKAINMFLGIVSPSCGVDCSGDGTVSIGEVQKVINAFLGLTNSC